jgi:hypothetical protein
MASDSSSEVKFEIGHVLFIDIVGYLKLLITEQSDQLQKLKEIVRGTEQVRIAEAEGKLLRATPCNTGRTSLLKLFQVQEKRSTFHPLAQRNAFRRRGARQQSKLFARSNPRLRRSPNSNRLC